jgi:hypothetical protein
VATLAGKNLCYLLFVYFHCVHFSLFTRPTRARRPAYRGRAGPHPPPEPPTNRLRTTPEPPPDQRHDTHCSRRPPVKRLGTPSPTYPMVGDRLTPLPPPPPPTPPSATSSALELPTSPLLAYRAPSLLVSYSLFSLLSLSLLSPLSPLPSPLTTAAVPPQPGPTRAPHTAFPHPPLLGGVAR